MEQENRQNFFEKKILPALLYVGTIGAVITSIAYIILVFVMIFGFKVDATLNTSIFACVNAGVGFIILQLLKYQGISFAEALPDNEKLLKEYYGTKTKDKKAHSMVYYWITSGIKDVFVKCASLAVTSVGLIYIIIKGSRDYNLIALASVNLLLFISFGLLGLVKSYKYFNTIYIEYIKEKLNEAKKGGKENGKEISQYPGTSREESSGH